jgi:hypothetical protein
MIILVTLAMSSCGDDSDTFLSSVTIDGPNLATDEDPTVSWFTTGGVVIEPTEGCNGIDGTCVYGPQGETETEVRQVWECQGSAWFSYESANNGDPEFFQ